MRKILYLTIFILSLSSFKLNNNFNNKYEPFEKLFLDFIMPSSDNVFRGIAFDMSREEVKAIELARNTTALRKSEKVDELIIECNMGSEVLDFVDITYYIDNEGVYALDAETYVITPQKSTYVFNKVKEFYSAKLGKYTLADDGYYDFKGFANDYKYKLSIKQVDFPPTGEEEGSYGMYLLIRQL